MRLNSLVLMSALLLGTTAEALAGSPDGTWKARAKDAPAGKVVDTLLFANGQFTSTECLQYGYQKGPYNSTSANNVTKWTAIQTNTNGDKMTWTGEIRGKKMTVSFQRTDKNGKPADAQEWIAEKVKK